VLDEHFLTDTGSLANGPPTEHARTHASLCHDQIASDMWEDYNRERIGRGGAGNHRTTSTVVALVP
jgi:hypothetical protein